MSHGDGALSGQLGCRKFIGGGSCDLADGGIFKCFPGDQSHIVRCGVVVGIVEPVGIGKIGIGTS